MAFAISFFYALSEKFNNERINFFLLFASMLLYVSINRFSHKQLVLVQQPRFLPGFHVMLLASHAFAKT